MPQFNPKSDITTSSRLVIRSFSPADQQAAKNLILEGLREHFGFINSAMNPDLNSIQTSYIENGALFLVAEIDSLLVGTGALVKEEMDIGRIVRVSVDQAYRRQGIGRRITDTLIAAAPKYGFTQLVVETNEDWFGAIRLYQQQCGFVEYERRDGEVHMIKYLKSVL